MNSPVTKAPVKSTSTMRGIVPFVAIALWFLLAIISARPAAAANGAFLTAGDILPDIEVALSAKGMTPEAVVQIDDAERAISTDFSITNTSFNPLSGRFVVRLSDGGTITGFAKSMHMIPVLENNIERGHIIDDSDIIYQEIAAPRTNSFVTNAKDLIGMTARRHLSANAPIRSNDVEAPILVNRGAIVTLSYKITGLSMTHQGVADSDGAMGDVVSVRNIATDRTLKGVVTDTNLITIVPRGGIVEG